MIPRQHCFPRPSRPLVRLVQTLAMGACLGVSMLVPVAPAAGQMRMGMMNAMGNSGVDKVNTRSINEYAALLNFADAQKAAALALHEAYSHEFDKAREARDDGFKKVREDFADSQDPGVWQRDLPKVVEAYNERTKQLDAQLLADMRELLDETQAAKWPQVERAHRRNQSTPSGTLSGESVDLIRIVNDLKVNQPWPDALQQATDRYATELDAALQERERVRTEAAKDMPQPGQRREGAGPFGFDMEAIQRAMTNLRKAGVPVREINDRFASVIQNSLPEDKQADFASSYRKAKFPQVFSDPYLFKAIEAAEKFPDITPEQKATMAEIRAAYVRDIEPANQTWAAEIGKAEADGGGDEMMANVQRMMSGGEAEQSDLAKARAARRKLDKDALEKLRAALTESQRDELPERDDPFGGNNFRFGGGGGGGGRGR